jgi:hypothetical protein
MRKCLIFIGFVFPVLVQAQLAELGVFAGGTHFLGDVGNQSIHLPQGWVTGMSFRYQFNEHYGLRFQGCIGELRNDDALSGWVSKQERNLSFRTPIWEAAVLIEFNFFEYITGSKKKNHSPYIFWGVGLFGFNPQAQFTDGEWYDLQPLGTEGQGTSLNSNAKYGLAGLSMPFGIGYRWSIGNSTSFAIETGFRRSSSDYIDDASGSYVNVAQLEQESGTLAAYFSDRSLAQTDKSGYARANDRTNDWYVFTGFHLYIALTPKNERCSRF